VKNSGTTIWSAAQNPYGLRANLAKVFGIPLDKMRVVYRDGSGSYGTNGADDAAADALLLSRRGHQCGQWCGRTSMAGIRKVGAASRLAAWTRAATSRVETQMWIGWPAGSRALQTRVGCHVQTMGRGRPVTLNLDPPYPVAICGWCRIAKDTPLRQSPRRQDHIFAVESFADELAVAAGMDPVAFRLRGLTDPRAVEVLKRASGMMDWQTRLSPNPYAAEGNFLVGRGMAYMRYKQAENYVALGITVAVNKATGKIAVRRVVCAHDCGLVVNPDGLRNQVEGNILQTLSRTLHEEVTFDRARVTSVDWASYPLLTFLKRPRTGCLIDRRNSRPMEPARQPPLP
jgi:hypothetical protein